MLRVALTASKLFSLEMPSLLELAAGAAAGTAAGAKAARVSAATDAASVAADGDVVKTSDDTFAGGGNTVAGCVWTALRR